MMRSQIRCGLVIFWATADFACAHGRPAGVRQASCGESRFVMGMNQYDVIKANPPGPVIFGEVTLAPGSKGAEVPELSIMVRHAVPFDASKIEWLYRASDGSSRWVVVAFEDHKVVAAWCASWNGKR